MPSEYEFIRLRLNMIERQLQSPRSEYIYTGDGRGRRRTEADVDTRQEKLYQREARLLRHILAHIPDGLVRQALSGWQSKFGTFLARHRERYSAQQDSYDAWWRLPPHERARMPRPPRPPLARFTDQLGQEWIIDDTFLRILDDISARLDKWIEEP